MGSGFYDFALDLFQDFRGLLRIEADGVELLGGSELEFYNIF
jgi:hypothetical protein